MENKRADLADKLEVIGQVFEIDGMSNLLSKYEKGMSMVKFNAVTIQITGLLVKNNKGLADQIIAMSAGKTDDEVQEMNDADYTAALRNAIIGDLLGFFGSSPSTDGEKSSTPSTHTSRARSGR